jgi:hypothetical protein
MNKKILSILIFATLLAGGFYFFVKHKNSKNEIEKIASHNETKSALKDAAPTTENLSSPAPMISTEIPALKVEASYEQKLRTEGYVDDPKNPERLMTMFKDASGKTKIFYRSKKDDSYDVPDKTSKAAWETLDSKTSISPAEDIRQLSRLEESNVIGFMLSGYFRDSENDIEAFFSSSTDEKGNLLNEDRICFVAPSLGINFKPSFGKHSLRVDETGYGVVKLTPALYLRIAWSREKKRIVHGDVVLLENGNHRTIKRFNATTVSRFTGEQLKYCK